MKEFVYNKGGTAIIRPLHFHDVKGFLLRIIRIMRGIYKEEAMSKNLEKTYNRKKLRRNFMKDGVRINIFTQK